jgi:FkbM family methyltransferase
MFGRVKQALRAALPKVTVTSRAVDRPFIKRYVCVVANSGGVMIDIGAGTGTGPESLMQEIGYRPENCYLIEACPQNFELLTKRCGSARTFNLALADHNGTVPLFVTDDPRWEGSSKSNTLIEGVMESKYGDGRVRGVQVPARTLASFFAENGLDAVDLIMVNCEGAEYLIFRDGIDCLKNTRMVWLEFHGFSRRLNKYIDEKRRILDLFEQAGFTRVAGMTRGEIDDSFGHTMILFERLPASRRAAA